MNLPVIFYTNGLRGHQFGPDNERQSGSVFSSLKNMLTKTKQQKSVHDLLTPF